MPIVRNQFGQSTATLVVTGRFVDSRKASISLWARRARCTGRALHAVARLS
jgi:hypothetical protein